MNGFTVVLVIVGLLATLALPALSYSKRAGTLSLFDCALPIAPAFSFLVGLQIFNASAQVGFAFFVYPVLCIALSLILLYIRIFALSHISGSHPKLSVGLLILACLLAFIAGATVPPWYE
jgi:hypothetical protein